MNKRRSILMVMLLVLLFTTIPVKEQKVQAKTSVKVSTITAKQTNSKVLVNGVSINFEVYTINNNNYFKLRDIAKVVSGTEKQFEVSYDVIKKAISLVSNKSYTSQGGELAKGDGKTKKAKLNTSTIYKNGEEVQLTAYTINGNNFFKLRDLADAFNIGVIWDAKTSTKGIDTTINYVK